MNTYRDLEIYKESRKLAVNVHLLSMKFPKFELYEEGSQIRRCSKSVTSMIVEGYGRKRYKAEFIRYLIMALAECDETIVHLDFLYDTKSLSEEDYKPLRSNYEILSKRINTYLQWVEHNWHPEKPCLVLK
jgi:four helix bundle protein